MGHGKLILDHQLRQSLQVGQVVGRQLLSVPQVSVSGIGVEILQVQFAQRRPVVIAGDANRGQGSKQLDTGVGIGP